MAFNHLWTNNFAAALESAELYLRQEPDEPFAYTLMATILAFQDQKKKAAQVIATLRERLPDFGITEMRMSQHYRERAKFEKVIRALKEAGLPD
jgi:predicted Zn-dependent protease